MLPETAGAQHVIGDNVRSGIDTIGAPRKRSDSVPLIASEPHEVFSHTAGSAKHEDSHRNFAACWKWRAIMPKRVTGQSLSQSENTI
jgi:hypothetical protein